MKTILVTILGVANFAGCGLAAFLYYDLVTDSPYFAYSFWLPALITATFTFIAGILTLYKKRPGWAFGGLAMMGVSALYFLFLIWAGFRA